MTYRLKCPCAACRPNQLGMIVCAECGNKRCPKATDHELACTRSNRPGQIGSSWENYPPFPEKIDLTMPKNETIEIREPGIIAYQVFNPNSMTKERLIEALHIDKDDRILDIDGNSIIISKQSLTKLTGITHDS